MSRLGIISDTHGLIRPQALAYLTGCEAILHAGDIGHPRVIHALEQIAPLVCIKGNIDTAAWAELIPEKRFYQWHDWRFLIIHNIRDLAQTDLSDCNAVIYGHSHQAKIHCEHDVLFFNPGSAGPRRFRLPIMLGEIRRDCGKMVALHHQLVE